MQRTGSEGRIQKLPRHKAERPCRCILRLSAVGFRTKPRAAAGYGSTRLNSNRDADTLVIKINTTDLQMFEIDDPPDFILTIVQEDLLSFYVPN
ncbi:hypothetical protein V6N13_102635 [Hibiscus sabdariffa]|uniref:Uncharacterized protein n=1 Tax=Hibiscus sabdariffa TaxID=183260 RepID=A0ABR2D5E8_9ROSI